MYRNAARAGLIHGHRRHSQHMVMFGLVVSEICDDGQTDRQTYKQTNTRTHHSTSHPFWRRSKHCTVVYCSILQQIISDEELIIVVCVRCLPGEVAFKENCRPIVASDVSCSVLAAVVAAVEPLVTAVETAVYTSKVIRRPNNNYLLEKCITDHLQQCHHLIIILCI